MPVLECKIRMPENKDFIKELVLGECLHLDRNII